jgi:hypothetical protein
MTRILLFIATALVATTAALGAAPLARACSQSSECYGRVNWATPSNTYTGGLSHLNASRLSVTDPNTQFVDHEIWVVTDGSYAWVEGGMTVGPINGHNYGLAIFWAEENTLGSYAEHFYETASLNTDYPTKISYSGSGRWTAYLSGSSMGESSANHSAYTTHLASGAELITNDAKVTGTMTGLQKRGSDGSTWSYNWTTNNFDQNSPATAGWTSAYTDAWDSAN